MVQIMSFLLNQTTLLLQLYKQYSEQKHHDLFTANEICSNRHLVSSIGQKNSHEICNLVEKRLQVSPLTNALRDVFNEIHLCGSITCTQYIESFGWKVFLLITICFLFATRLGYFYFYNVSQQQQQYEYYTTTSTLKDGASAHSSTVLPTFRQLSYDQQYDILSSKQKQW